MKDGYIKFVIIVIVKILLEKGLLLLIFLLKFHLNL